MLLATSEKACELGKVNLSSACKPAISHVISGQFCGMDHRMDHSFEPLWQNYKNKSHSGKKQKELGQLICGMLCSRYNTTRLTGCVYNVSGWSLTCKKISQHFSFEAVYRYLSLSLMSAYF